MKDKNLPHDNISSSLEELTDQANQIIVSLENEKDLNNSIEPPNLNSDGLFVRLMIVDSTPILHLPPFNTYLTLDPNSSLTSEA